MEWTDDGKCFSLLQRIDSQFLKWYASRDNTKNWREIKLLPGAGVAGECDAHVQV